MNSTVGLHTLNNTDFVHFFVQHDDYPIELWKKEPIYINAVKNYSKVKSKDVVIKVMRSATSDNNFAKIPKETRFLPNGREKAIRYICYCYLTGKSFDDIFLRLYDPHLTAAFLIAFGRDRPIFN